MLGPILLAQACTMKKLLRQLLNDLLEPKPDSGQKTRKSHSLELAASVILLETAAMDDDIAEAEMSQITEILQKHFKLDGVEAAEVIDAARNVRDGAVDLHQFTQIINENCSKDRKVQLIESIWQVIYADGRLDKYEDYFVHKLAGLLHVDHKDLITAKLKTRDDINRSLVNNDSADCSTDT